MFGCLFLLSTEVEWCNFYGMHSHMTFETLALSSLGVYLKLHYIITHTIYNWKCFHDGCIMRRWYINVVTCLILLCSVDVSPYVCYPSQKQLTVKKWLDTEMSFLTDLFHVYKRCLPTIFNSFMNVLDLPYKGCSYKIFSVFLSFLLVCILIDNSKTLYLAMHIYII